MQWWMGFGDHLPFHFNLFRNPSLQKIMKKKKKKEKKVKETSDFLWLNDV
jgi:hypothetical protein